MNTTMNDNQHSDSCLICGKALKPDDAGFRDFVEGDNGSVMHTLFCKGQCSDYGQAMIRLAREISESDDAEQIFDDLAAAAKEAGLSSVPIDIYSGEALHYNVLDGRPVLYSVGSDQIDDGGLVDWNYGQQPGDFVLLLRD